MPATYSFNQMVIHHLFPIPVRVCLGSPQRVKFLGPVVGTLAVLLGVHGYLFQAVNGTAA